MAEYRVPEPLIDLGSLPPPLLTSEPGSFPHHTLAVRVPKILAETLAQNRFDPEIAAAVEALRAEVLGGRIRLLQEDTPDKPFWDEVSRPYEGRTWLDVPWYWAEAYLYRRLLEATRYFQTPPEQRLDPFAVTKQTEWAAEVAPAAVNNVLEELPGSEMERWVALLGASLWGNRIDLSYKVAVAAGRSGGNDEQANLLVNDAGDAWEHAQGRAGGDWIFICDNAGTELAMDLALVDFVLSQGLAGRATMHLKPQPFFVSDAMPEDVEMGLRALADGGKHAQALAERLHAHRRDGRLALRTHWFYVTSLFYFQLPDDLRSDLSEADLIVVKGDANYRRLLGDAHWPPATPFADAVAYFPAPLLALRTLKGPIIVGLKPGEAERIEAKDPDWLINARRGLIQAELQRT